MTKIIVIDGTILIANHDLSPFANSLVEDFQVPEVETTNLESQGWKEVLGGIAGGTYNAKGFRDFSDRGTAVDLDLFSVLSDVPVLGAHTNPLAEGDFAKGFLAQELTYELTNNIGEAAGFTTNFSSTAPGLNLRVLAAGTKATTADGGGVNAGAVSATQRLYGALWIEGSSVAGTTPTLDVVIESDATNSFSGAEVTRMTFSQETDATANYQYATPVIGPITDTWWRATWVIGGTGSPSFKFAVAIAIQ